jgi:hypothetical protein
MSSRGEVPHLKLRCGAIDWLSPFDGTFDSHGFSIP